MDMDLIFRDKEARQIHIIITLNIGRSYYATLENPQAFKFEI